MIQDEYSPYKIIHHKNILGKLRNKEFLNPVHVQMVITNKCNLNCSFCAYRMDGYSSNEQFNSNDSLSFEKSLQCINDLKSMGTKAIEFTGGGEPTVHPDFTYILQYALEKDFECALVTNGVNISDKMFEQIQHLSWIRISLDAFKKETYSKLKKCTDFTLLRVMSTIQRITKFNKPVVGVGFVINKDNWKEVFSAARLARDLGVNNFRISTCFSPEGYSYCDEYREEAIKLCYEVEKLNNDNFKVFNLFNARLKDQFEKVQDYDFCPIKEIHTYIGADYNIYTCCTLAYNKKGLIGSIKDRSLKTVWNQNKKRYNHNPRIMCKLPCLFKTKNEFINYCIKDNPKHVNFL